MKINDEFEVIDKNSTLDLFLFLFSSTFSVYFSLNFLRIKHNLN